MDAQEIAGSFVVAPTGGRGGTGGADGSTAKLHFLFLHACEEGDVEQVHTLLSMFGGKDLNANVHKDITSENGQLSDGSNKEQADGLSKEEEQGFAISARVAFADPPRCPARIHTSLTFPEDEYRCLQSG